MRPELTPVTFDPARLRFDRGGDGIVLDGEKLQSVGRMVKRFAPFERDEISRNRAGRPSQDGPTLAALTIEQDAIKAEWDESRDNGIRAHSYMERVVMGEAVFPTDPYQRGFLKWWKAQKHTRVIALEQCIIDPIDKYGGIVDLVLERGWHSHTVLIDVKTGSWSDSGRRRLLPPLQHLTDSKLIKTSLQTGLYRRAVVRHYGRQIDATIALYLGADGVPHEIDLPLFEDEMDHLLHDVELGERGLWVPPTMPTFKPKKASKVTLAGLPLFKARRAATRDVTT